MTTSTNEPGSDGNTLTPDQAGGAFSDALTFARIVITPIIMALILWRWPETQIALLATVLLIVAGLTDIFDDYFGGASRSAVRRYGYLDDAADTILFVGVLIALSVVLLLNGLFAWTFAVPALILVGRELFIAATKGGALRRFGWADNIWSSLKSFFAIAGTATLVASPWLTAWLDDARAGTDKAVDVYGTGSPTVWIVGQTMLWLAALFSLVSAVRILRHDFSAEA
ncbi:MAG: CDP-alcohol phosphatidyltransferase family protein [Litorimonas sp.]